LGTIGLDRNLWFDLCHIPYVDHCSCIILFGKQAETQNIFKKAGKCLVEKLDVT
jgi:hypothetical protein